jgi:hypothetical protein
LKIIDLCQCYFVIFAALFKKHQLIGKNEHRRIYGTTTGGTQIYPDFTDHSSGVDWHWRGWLFAMAAV